MTGTLFLVNMNESDSPDCCKLGLNVSPHCTVKELYPLISSTVLALEDTDTLNDGTTYCKRVNFVADKLGIFLPKILIGIDVSPAITLVFPGIVATHLSLNEMSLNVIGLKTSSEDCPLMMETGRGKVSWAPPALTALQVSTAPTTLLVHVTLRCSPV